MKVEINSENREEIGENLSSLAEKVAEGQLYKGSLDIERIVAIEGIEVYVTSA